MKLNCIYTTKSRKENNTDFGIWDKDIKEDLHKHSMIVILNWCARTLTKSMNKKRKEMRVTNILHEQEDGTKKLENIYTHFIEQVVNKPIEDKEIYLGQLIMIANIMKIKGMVKKDLSVSKK